MQLCVIFYNLGGYHLARLEAARQECNRRGWTFTAVQIAGGTAEHPWGDLPVPDYVRTLLPFQDGATPVLGSRALLENLLEELQPDAVAVPGWGFDFARAALDWCRRKKRIPVLMSESKYDDAPRQWWKEFYKKWRIVRHFPAAIVGGQKHRSYLRQLGISDSAIFEGYDVVDNDYFAKQADRLRQSGLSEHVPQAVRGRRFFLAASRFIPRKNLARLIKAFHQIVAQDKQKFQDWDLVLLGGGSEDAQLKALANSMSPVGRVHFPGFQSYQQVCAWYAFAEVFVHPALSEQWGLVVNEAMASELPILLSRTCGCFPDLLQDGVNGYSFDPESVNELAEKMALLADNSSLRQQMGVASRELINARFPAAAFGQALANAVEFAS